MRGNPFYHFVGISSHLILGIVSEKENLKNLRKEKEKERKDITILLVDYLKGNHDASHSW